MIEKQYYDDDPHWRECLNKYIDAELVLGVKELVNTKNNRFNYKGMLINLSPERFEILLSILRQRYQELQGMAKENSTKK